MKKILAFFLIAFVAGSSYATNGTVVVDVNTAVLTWPTNFWTANGIVVTNTTTNHEVRITALETNINSYSNGLNVKIIAATNATTNVANRVAILETNTATKAQGIEATNANAHVTIWATNFPWTNVCLTTTGTVTALNFIGSGVGLTGVTATVTGAVNSINVGTNKFMGDLVFTGPNITYGGPNTVNISRVEYITKQIVLTTNTYEYTMEGPRDTAFRLDKVFSKADAYNATFSILTMATNSAWRVDTTDLITGIQAETNGTWTISGATIASNLEWGIRIDDFDPRATQIRVMYKITTTN